MYQSIGSAPLGGIPDYSAMLGMTAAPPLVGGGTGMPGYQGIGMAGIGAPGGGSGGMGAMGVANAGLAGLQTLGALWGAWQQNKMAKKQFKFTKDITNTNLANQIKSYNTALYDRARSRAVMESQTDAERDAYVNNNSLSRSSTGSHKSDAYTHNYGNGSSAPMLAGSNGGSTSGVGSFSALADRAAAERSRPSPSRDEEVARG